MSPYDLNQKKNDRVMNGPEDTIDLLELFTMLLSHWKVILIAVLIAGILGGVYNKFFVKTSYKTDSKIYISSSGTVVEMTDLKLSDELTADYAEMIKSRTVLKQVIRELGLNMSYQSLSNMVSVSNPKDSHCMVISVRSSSPSQAIQITNCLVKVSVKAIYDMIGHEEPYVIDAAEEDDVTAIRESLSKTAILWAMVAGVLVCGIYVVLFLLDSTLKSEADVSKYMGLPVLVGIPFREEQAEKNGQDRRNEKKNDRKRGKDILPEASTEAEGNVVNPVLLPMDFRTREAFNMLRGSIQMSGYGVKVFAVTSAGENEGKSEISFRLANSLAALGKKVIFLDCDIRNTCIKQRYQITHKTPGLSEYLCGMKEKEEIIFHMQELPMDIIFAGASAPNPSELLSGARFDQLIESLKGEYEYVIADTPPCNLVVDGLLIARSCGKAIIIVESGRTDRKEAAALTEKLESLEISITGVVMNKVDERSGRYGKRGKYGKYGHYGYGGYYGAQSKGYGKYEYKDYGYAEETSKKE